MFTLKDPTLLRTQCFINGRWCDADNGETITVTNPATGEVIGTVPRMGRDGTWLPSYQDIGRSTHCFWESVESGLIF